MAYIPDNLTVLAYSNGFTLWHYVSDEEPVGERYFAGADDLLRGGDVIECGYQVGHKRLLVVVDDVAGRVVTVRL